MPLFSNPTRYVIGALLLLLPAGLVVPLAAQSSALLTESRPSFRALVKAGDNAFAQKDYFTAMKYFEMATQVEPDNLDGLYKYAQSARLFNAFTLADSAYTAALERDTTGQLPELAFWAGEVKKQLGQYDEAIVLFQSFLEKHGAGLPELAERARHELEACNWALDMLAAQDPDVDIHPLDDEVNTPYAEFGALRLGDTLYFSSYSFTQKEKKQYPPRQFSKLLMRVGDQPPVLVSFNDEKEHTAYLTFTPDRSRAFFNICRYVTAASIRCELYALEVHDGQPYGTPMRLPTPLNLEGFTSTQPHVGYDPQTGEQGLFFVSDRPEGKGGLDIWYAPLDSMGLPGEPLNLAEVNTPGNDVTPFFDSEMRRLYFSSNGRRSMGGYDVFRADKTDNGWGEVVNIGPPINGSFDETHFVVEPGGAGGFFASNRLGSKFLAPEYEACCSDLYAFQYKALQLNLFTYNHQTRDPLSGVAINLYELKPNGELHLVTSADNPDANDFRFPLERNKKYVIVASRPGFLDHTDTLDMRAPEFRGKRQVDYPVYLQPKQLELLVKVFNAKSGRPLKGAEVRVAESGQEVAFQEDEQKTEYKFTLERGKKYEIIGNKVAFNPDTIRLDLTDTRNPVYSLEEKLFLDPKEIEDFPPLVLYFDNDQPDPDSWKATTDKTYEETYRAYMARKDLFVREYVKVLEGRDSFLAANRLAAFFDREVRNGYESLLVFSDNLLRVLQQGFKVELEIQGFTSPRARENYNERLSKRRANCLKNHFLTYKNGALKPYIENGQLVLKEIGFGEKLAPQYISDRLDDERGSIYSLAASAERKVAIIGATVFPGN